PGPASASRSRRRSPKRMAARSPLRRIRASAPASASSSRSVLARPTPRDGRAATSQPGARLIEHPPLDPRSGCIRPRSRGCGVRLAFRTLGSPKVPLVAIGYSRGGELVADYTAVAPLAGPAPAEVLTVFPAGQDPADPPFDLRSVDPRTRFTILLGDHDSVVD